MQRSGGLGLGDELLEPVVRGVQAQGGAGAVVEAVLDALEVLGGVHSEVGAFREPVAQEPVGVPYRLWCVVWEFA